MLTQVKKSWFAWLRAASVAHPTARPCMVPRCSDPEAPCSLISSLVLGQVEEQGQPLAVQAQVSTKTPAVAGKLKTPATCWMMRGGAKGGLQCEHAKQFVVVLLFINYCIIFYMNTCKPTFASPFTEWFNCIYLGSPGKGRGQEAEKLPK